MPIYEYNGERYDIPTEVEEQFIADVPDAKKLPKPEKNKSWDAAVELAPGVSIGGMSQYNSNKVEVVDDGVFGKPMYAPKEEVSTPKEEMPAPVMQGIDADAFNKATQQRLNAAKSLYDYNAYSNAAVKRGEIPTAHSFEVNQLPRERAFEAEQFAKAAKDYDLLDGTGEIKTFSAHKVVDGEPVKVNKIDAPGQYEVNGKIIYISPNALHSPDVAGLNEALKYADMTEEAGFWETVGQGFENQLYGNAALLGETFNLLSGSSHDDKEILANWDEFFVDGNLKTPQQMGFRGSNEVQNLNINMTVNYPDSYKDYRDYLQEILAENGGDLNKAKAIIKERANSASVGDDILDWATEGYNSQKPSMSGFGGFVAEMIPNMTGQAAAMAAAAAHPVAGAVVRGVDMGIMSGTTAGLSMIEARNSGATTGETWFAGLIDGAIELVTEKIPYDMAMKRVLRPRIAKQSAKLATEIANNPTANKEMATLLTRANKELGGKLFSGKNVKDYMSMVAAEGMSEFTAEGLQTITPMVYKNPEDYPTLSEIINNGVKGALGGLFMGAVLGGAAKGMQHKADNARRRKQGDVVVASVTLPNGKSAIGEVLAKVDDNTFAVQVDNEVVELPKDKIGVRYSYTYEEFVTAELQHSEAEGYSEINPAAMTALGDEYGLLREKALATLGENVVAQLDADPIGALVGLTGPDVDDAIEYINAKKRYDGMINRISDDIDERIAMSDKEIESHKNRQDGAIHPAMMRGVNGAAPKKVYIVNGNVATREDGTIDKANSSSMIIVRDAETGEVSAASADDLENIDAVIDTEAEKKSVAEQIANEYAAEQAILIDGDLPFVVGDVYSLTDNAQGAYEATVVSVDGDNVTLDINGQQVVDTKANINAAAKATRLAALRASRGSEPVAAPVVEDQIGDNTGKVVESSPAGEAAAPVVEAPKTALEQIPKDKKGIPLYEQVDSELAWDGVVEEAGGNEETAMVAVNSMVADKQDALKKAEKAKAKAGVTITEKIAAENERIANIEKAKADLAKWEEIAGVKAKRAAVQAAEMPQVETEPVQTEKVTPTEATTPTVAEAEPVVETPQATNEMQEAVVEPVGELGHSTLSQPSDQVAEGGNAPGQSGVLLSDEVDENGRQFVLNSNGNIVFGEIAEDTGLTPAPILLSEGLITNPATNDGYGLVHIEARHGDQIRNAGYNSVVEFVEEVAKNYEVIREGKDRDGHQTYMLQLTDKHNNTLMVELSGDDTYWNINTAGIFKTSYGKNRKEVYNRHTTAKQPTETVEASQDTEQSGTQATSSMNTPTTSSASEDSNSVSNKQENTQKSGETAENGGENAVPEWLNKVPDDGRNFFVYVKFAGENKYQAIDLGKGETVDRLVRATMLQKEQLQVLVDKLPSVLLEDAEFQIRDAKGNIYYNSGKVAAENEVAKQEDKDVAAFDKQAEIAKEREQRAGVAPRPGHLAVAIGEGNEKAVEEWKAKFDSYLQKLNADDLPTIDVTIKGMQGRKRDIREMKKDGYKDDSIYKAYDYIETALKKRAAELKKVSATEQPKQENKPVESEPIKDETPVTSETTEQPETGEVANAGPVNMETLQLNMGEEDFNALLSSGDKAAISEYLAEMDGLLRIGVGSPLDGRDAIVKEYRGLVEQYGGEENIPADVAAVIDERIAPYNALQRAVFDRKYALQDKLREIEASEAQAKEQEEKEAKAEHKQTAFNGFLAGKSDVGASTAEKALDKRYKFDDGVHTVAEYIEQQLENGTLKIETREEPKYKGVSRAAWNRMDARQQEADAKRVKESGTKTVYTVNDHDLGKTAYDYAKFLLDKKAEQETEEGDVVLYRSAENNEARAITYDEAVQIGNDFAKTHKGAAKKMVFSKGAAEVEQQMRDAGFTELSIEVVLDNYKKGDPPTQSYLRSSDGIVFYEYPTDIEVYASLWHENGHRAMRMIYGDDLSEIESIFDNLPEIIKSSCIEFLEARNYDPEDYPKESVTYFIEGAYRNGAFADGDYDIARFFKNAERNAKDFYNFVQQIIDYTRYGQKETRNNSGVNLGGDVQEQAQEWNAERREEGAGAAEATTGTAEATGGLTEEEIAALETLTGYARDEIIDMFGYDLSRSGNGPLTDREVVMESDPYSKVLGKPRYYGKRQREFVARQRRRIAEKARQVAEKLNLDNVEVLESTEGLTGKKATSKGWFDPRTGKITVVVPNHGSTGDIVETVLHEAVAHYGLRKLFGENFKNFLDNVYRNVTPEIRAEITELAKKHGWDFHTATEEYLASLAENTNFERVNPSLWSQIKSFFMKMLAKVGIKLDFELSDNELRYILWRSYQNLAYPGMYNTVFGQAEDIAKQYELGVGNYASGEVKTENGEVAAEDDSALLHREGGAPGSALEEYNHKVRRPNASGSVGKMDNLPHRVKEAYQDSMLALKTLQEAISHETGKEITDNENAYIAENRMSSSNKVQTEIYERDFLRPLWREIEALVNAGVEYDDVIRYMHAKHGIERNEYMRRKQAEEAARREKGEEPPMPKADDPDYEAKVETKNAWREELEELTESYVKKFAKRDYAGLTALTETKNAVEAEAAAQQMVDEFEREHNTQSLWGATNKATKETLRREFVGGLIDRKTYDSVRTMFDFYIPLRGWNDKVAANEYEYFTNNNAPIFTPALKTMHGRKSLADDPIATIGYMAGSAIARANRNLMKQKLFNLVANNPTSLATVSEQWYVKDFATDTWEARNPEIPEDATPEQVIQLVEAHEANMRALEKSGLATRERSGLKIGLHATKQELQQHVVRVMRNGKEYAIYINGNPRAAQAVNGLTNPDASSSKAYKVATTVKNLMARAFTSSNPAFIFTNLSRDVIWAGVAVAAKEDATYTLQYTKNISAILMLAKLPRLLHKFKNGTLDMNNEIERYFDEFMRNGGETGFTQVSTVEDYKRDIKRFMKDARRAASVPGKVGRISKKGWRSFWNGVEFMNRSVEDITRFAVYMTSRQTGRSIARSVYDAKEITVNFNKKGSGGFGAKYLNFAYLFFNAAVQSLGNFGKLIKNHPGKTAAALGTFGALGFFMPLINAALIAMGDDDDENAYWDLPEWVRRNNIVIYAPFTDDGFITIPLPHELRPFYGMGESAMTALQGKDTAENAVMDSALGFTGMLPLDYTGNGGNVLVNITPSFAQPVAQVIANVDYFGKPIYKDTPFNELDPEWKKAYKGTNSALVEATKWLNKATRGNNVDSGWLDFNPGIIEHLVEGYTGGLGKTINNFGKTISMIWDEDAREVRNIPVVSSFYQVSDERTSGNQLNRQYFNALDEMERIRHQISGYREEAMKGDAEYARLLEELVNSQRLKRYEIMKNYSSAISDINKVAENYGERMTSEELKEMESIVTNLKQEMLDELEKLQAEE